MPKIYLNWSDVFDRLHDNMPHHGTAYGVPRGGSIVAALLGVHRMAKTPEEADFIVDDIIDSGKTQAEYSLKYHNKPFYVLVNKIAEGWQNEWCVFPWEHEHDKGAEENVTALLTFIGEDPRREGLIDTPKRVIRAYSKLFGGYKEDPKTVLKTRFTNEENYDQMVVLKDIEFYSTCEHHMIPFFGKAKIAYLPDKHYVGISKLARLLEVYARRLQVQERLTQQIAQAIDSYVHPLGVGVVIEAQHMCMTSRGVEKQHSKMVTSCLLGAFKEGATREEFMKL